ncbi:hypothetical protein CF065_07770 [Clostridium sporogenes]
MFRWINSAGNIFKNGINKIKSLRVSNSIKKGVRQVSTSVGNIFKGPRYISEKINKIKTNTRGKISNRSRKKNSSGCWRTIKKFHSRMNPKALLIPGRYASEERQDEDIGTRILNDLWSDVAFMTGALIIALEIWDINDNMNSLSLAGAGNGISVFPTGKSFRKVAKIGGDGTKKSKNLYKFATKGTGNLGNKAISELGSNKIHHILQEHHDWGKLVKDPKDWGQVSKIVSKVLNEGIEGSYKSVYSKTLNMGGNIVEVTYVKFKNGIIKI